MRSPHSAYLLKQLMPITENILPLLRTKKQI